MIVAKCVQLNNDGWDSYEELELGKTYEVDYADVGRCYTYVYLKGFSRPFNSVCFDYYKNGKEIDIIEEYIDSYYQKYKRGQFIMKYFEPFKTGFLHDVAGLRAWLEKRGKLNCNDEVLEGLWMKFSDDYDAQWLVFNTNDAEDFWLNKFLDWLKYKEKECGED